jgi:hypothetical protein
MPKIKGKEPRKGKRIAPPIPLSSTRNYDLVQMFGAIGRGKLLRKVEPTSSPGIRRRGHETPEGRQARESQANLPVDEDSGAQARGQPRFAAGGSAREEGVALVAPSQEGGKPWRAENPGEDRLQSVG